MRAVRCGIRSPWLYDRCNPPRIEAEETFFAIVSGFVGPFGDVNYTTGSPSAPGGMPGRSGPYVARGDGTPMPEAPSDDVLRDSTGHLARLFEESC